MTDTITARVVTTITEKTGVDGADLPPLYDAIDPDLIEALFDGREDGSSRERSERELRFEYVGREVRIRNGEVTVGDPV